MTSPTKCFKANHGLAGQVHDSLQQVDGFPNTVDDLLARLLPEENPILQWNAKKDEILPTDLGTWFPRDDKVAFYAPSDHSEELTNKTSYAELQTILDSFPRYHPDQQDTTLFVVAILLPTNLMAETAVSLLSVMAHGNGVCAAPLDPSMTSDRLNDALKQLNCRALVTTRELWENMEGGVSNEVTRKLEDVRLVSPKTDSNLAGDISWTFVVRQQQARATDVSARPDATDDKLELPVLLLRTSGTTCKPKIVPLLAPALLYNAICIASSLKLTRSDIDLNAMPLYHIGGIACALLSVLVSGSGVIWNGPFDAVGFLQRIAPEATARDKEAVVTPTWYYGVPTMHKSLVLVMQKQQASASYTTNNNKLRFIRSGAAHLSHDVAVELAQLLRTTVIPTYSMSECMPVCSSANPIVWNEDATVADTVGPPIAPNMRIVDTVTGETVPHGSSTIGEVCLDGPGVIKFYLGRDVAETHTPDGWLRTGDMGCLDREGRLFLKGRTKEMIKRGGEQVWPNEIDDVVASVEGVATAVTFGVANEMWGEEVAVAVVLEDDGGKARNVESVHNDIICTCRKKLAAAAVPAQIAFVHSTDRLLKGPTGKYLRTRMAQHLNITAVDNGALNALQSAPVGVATAVAVGDSVLPEAPSEALNGLRFLVAMFVVQIHAGYMPSAEWSKIQNFSFNMIIFMAIGAMQLATLTKGDVCGTWSTFVGTKIGSMHALFLVTQFMALSAFLLMQCGDKGYLETFEDSSCDGGTLAVYLATFLSTTILTPIMFGNLVNPVTWFQSAFYIFLMLFPLLHKGFRGLQNRSNGGLIALFLFIASITPIVLYVAGLDFLMFHAISWIPHLIASMLVGYRFLRVSAEEKRKGGGEDYSPAFKRSSAIATDVISVILLLITVIVSSMPALLQCINVRQSLFEELRPGEDLPTETFEQEGFDYVRMCQYTFDEFDIIRRNEVGTADNGYLRYTSSISDFLSYFRMGTPLVLLWLYFLSFGHGLTARLFSNRVMKSLSPLAYSIYLLHSTVLRFYWIATRGMSAKKWWGEALMNLYPIRWYEVFFVIAISTLVGWVLENTIVPVIMPYSIKVWIGVAKLLEKCCGCCCCNRYSNAEPALPSGSETIVFRQLAALVRGLTGSQVTRETNLRDLGLDSLGATALLSTLRASVSAAKNLTMRQLNSFQTVGDLADFLNEGNEKEVADVA